jgi:hypothetical protein
MLTDIIKFCCNPVSDFGEETSIDIYPCHCMLTSCTLSIPYIKVHECISDTLQPGL